MTYLDPACRASVDVDHVVARRALREEAHSRREGGDKLRVEGADRRGGSVRAVDPLHRSVASPRCTGRKQLSAGRAVAMHGTGSCKLVLDVENRPYDENERHGVQRCGGKSAEGSCEIRNRCWHRREMPKRPLDDAVLDHGLRNVMQSLPELIAGVDPRLQSTSTLPDAPMVKRKKKAKGALSAPRTNRACSTSRQSPFSLTLQSTAASSRCAVTTTWSLPVDGARTEGLRVCLSDARISC